MCSPPFPVILFVLLPLLLVEVTWPHGATHIPGSGFGKTLSVCLQPSSALLVHERAPPAGSGIRVTYVAGCTGVCAPSEVPGTCAKLPDRNSLNTWSLNLGHGCGKQVLCVRVLSRLLLSPPSSQKGGLCSQGPFPPTE